MRRLSSSSLKMYPECFRKWKLNYIDRLPARARRREAPLLRGRGRCFHGLREPDRQARRGADRDRRPTDGRELRLERVWTDAHPTPYQIGSEQMLGMDQASP